MRDTSIAAYKSAMRTAETVRGVVFRAIASSPNGATQAELSERLGLRTQSTTGRITELYEAGCIVDSGQRRPTDSGHDAIVWVESPEGYTKPIREPSPTEQLRALQRKCCKLLDAYHNWYLLSERGSMDALRNAVREMEDAVSYERGDGR